MNFADFMKTYMEEQEKKKKEENPMKVIYKTYCDIVDAGFDEDQAMFLLIETLKIALGARND